MRAKKVITGIVSTVLSASLLLGCGRTDSTEVSTLKESTEPVEEGYVNYETSTLGIDSNSKNFEEQLTDGMYYVVHEGIYYPLYFDYRNDEAKDSISTSVDEDRMCFYNTDNFVNIPTLLSGDHLVFYSQTQMLDYIQWERYKDLGITLGMYDLKETMGGKIYLDFSDKDVIPIVDSSDLMTLAELGIDNITVDKIGGVALDNSVVEDGIVVGVTEGTSYDIEVYTGTHYKHYNSIANVRAFKSYELYASTGMETLQDCFWEIDIPEYFVNGYYNIDNKGLVRIVKDSGYSKDIDFNEQVLFPDVSEYDGSISVVRMYSENENLNSFRQTQFPEELGYVDPDAKKDEAKEDEMENSLPEAAQFKEANIKTYELWFPEGKQCEIVITSKTGEATGSATITFDTGGSTAITYNRFDKNYTAIVNGKGNVGTLQIGGFWYDYDIQLTNVELYDGQDKAVEAVDSDAVAEDAPVIEEDSSENVDAEQETEAE